MSLMGSVTVSWRLWIARYCITIAKSYASTVNCLCNVPALSNLVTFLTLVSVDSSEPVHASFLPIGGLLGELGRVESVFVRWV